MISLKPIIGRSWLRSKTLCLLFAFVFLCATLACSHNPNKPSQKDPRAGISSFGETQAVPSNSAEAPWWKNPEYEWLIATLIVIGIGISIGAAIMISSGPGGLRIHIKN